jgi:hypothetical protein
MASGRKPTASEVLNVMDHLQRDRDRRLKLDRGDGIFRACVAEGLLNTDSIDWLAQAMQELYGEGLIAYGSVHGGITEPSVWDSRWIQAMYDWRVTSAGRADAALYRRESGRVSFAESAVPGGDHDLFISHASEDKEMVRRLRDALTARGWSVWLDELELTVGDSVSSRIDEALARSRFGVVVLSTAFFAKPWPKRELEGLTAREVAAGSKVILPVWHGVDEHYIVKHSPILADRLGVSTSLGSEEVADKLSLAVERAGLRAAAGLSTEPVLQSAEPSSRLTIPTTAEQQARLVIERPDWWEHLLLAGVLVQGRNELEAKWADHELRLPGGRRREVDQVSAFAFVSREIGWLGDQIALFNRIFSPSAQEQAFGAAGEPGNVARIEHLARRVIKLYESMMDWAAELRNTAVPDAFTDVREATACYADGPLKAIHEFIDRNAEQIALLPELAAETPEGQPIRIEHHITITIDDAVSERALKALDKAHVEL